MEDLCLETLTRLMNLQMLLLHNNKTIPLISRTPSISFTITGTTIGTFLGSQAMAGGYSETALADTDMGLDELFMATFFDILTITVGNCLEAYKPFVGNGLTLEPTTAYGKIGLEPSLHLFRGTAYLPEDTSNDETEGHNG